MRIRLRVADATHRVEVQQSLEELLLKVSELICCQPGDVRIGLNKQVNIEFIPAAPPPFTPGVAAPGRHPWVGSPRVVTPSDIDVRDESGLLYMFRRR